MSNSDPIIEVRHLTRRFRRKCAVEDVSFTVPNGCVFGLLGENGAGKTTLIKHILGAYVAQKGTVRVLGLDPVTHPVEVLGRLGYLSEDREMPTWMRVGELMRFTKAFYSNWDPHFAEELLEMFRLDPEAKLETLSRGELAKTGLLIALAHRPDVLILDEPSSGLDPIARRDILTAIIRNVADEGRAVFFSSHLLDEVERVSDHVAMMAEGKIILSGTLDDVKKDHHRLTIRYDAPLDTAPEIEGAFSCQGAGKEWTIICNGQRDRILHHLKDANGKIVDDQSATLEEIFFARTKHARVRTS